MHSKLLEAQHLWAFVSAAIARRGENPLWIQRLPKGEKRTTSYASIGRRAVALSRRLREAGVGAGDRVAVLAGNGPDWGAAAFAVWRLGAILAPLHTGNSDEELRTQHDALAPKCTLFTVDNRGLPNAIEIDGDEEEDDGFVPPDPEPDSEAARIYTSGTTGNAKIVRLSHDNILSNIRGAARLDIPISHKDRFLSLLPLSHAMEMTGGMLLPMYHSATIVIPRMIAAGEILEAMKEEQITLMIAVPRLFRNIMLGMEKKFNEGGTLLRAYVQVIRRSPGWLSRIINAPLRRKFGGSIRCWLSGGSRLDPEIARYFRTLGFPLIQGYGLTECGPVVSVQSMHDPRLDSVGEPLHGMEVRIHEPNASGDGELWVRGPNLMLGYLDRKQTAESWKTAGTGPGTLPGWWTDPRSS
jgi:long-chain acyl-CoA synthetase